MRKIKRLVFLFFISISILFTNTGCISSVIPNVVDEDGNEIETDIDGEGDGDITMTSIMTVDDESKEILHGTDSWRKLWDEVLSASGQPFTNYHGQCTSYAWYRFNQVYCFDSGARGNGDLNASEIVNAHPDLFELSSTPKAGSVFSWRDVLVDGTVYIHVGFVEGYDPATGIVRISDGNIGPRFTNYYTIGGYYVADGGFRINVPQTIQSMNSHTYVAYAVPKSSPSEITACRYGD